MQYLFCYAHTAQNRTPACCSVVCECFAFGPHRCSTVLLLFPACAAQLFMGLEDMAQMTHALIGYVEHLRMPDAGPVDPAESRVVVFPTQNFVACPLVWERRICAGQHYVRWWDQLVSGASVPYREGTVRQEHWYLGDRVAERRTLEDNGAIWLPDSGNMCEHCRPWPRAMSQCNIWSFTL